MHGSFRSTAGCALAVLLVTVLGAADAALAPLRLNRFRLNRFTDSLASCGNGHRAFAPTTQAK